MRTRTYVAVAIGLLAQLATTAAKADVTLLTFTSGTPIKATEVNANFDTLRSKIGTTNVVLGDGSQVVGPAVSGAVVVGGNTFQTNQVTGDQALVVGGNSNRATGITSAVLGGVGNTASAQGGIVACGEGNTASGSDSGILGGFANIASGAYSSVLGGTSNTASGLLSAVLGGNVSTASGQSSVVLGGTLNVAQGAYSVAMGRRAKAQNDGCFVWADSTNADINCSANNRWVARASGGVYFYTNSGATTGVSLSNGSGSWASISDRQQKKDFVAVDAKSVLERVRKLPISTWRYLSEESGATHMGPMAQDFRAAFGLGDSEKTITSVDADGVALAAVQGLDVVTRQHMAELERDVKALRTENARLRSSQNDLDARLARMERGLGGKALVHASDVFGSPWTLALGSCVALGVAFGAGRRRRSESSARGVQS